MPARCAAPRRKALLACRSSGCAALSALCAGDFLQGFEIERSAPFSAWLTGQRRHLRAAHAAILEHRVRALPAACDEAVSCLEQWLQLAPFDRHAHELLLDALARRGRIREGDEHLAATARAFEAESARLGADRPGLACRQGAPCRGAGVAARRRTVHPDRVHDAAEPVAAAQRPQHRASIAVMPFADAAREGTVRGGLADGLAYDVITRLAKLRSLFVIAPGTVFALDERQVGAEEAGRRLNVDYVAGGTLRRAGGHLHVNVQLTETRSARIVWADTITARYHDALGVLEEIGNRIVASIAHQIELAERNRAVLKPPNSLDAWEAHHRGLWHMYRFNRDDNLQARHFFETCAATGPDLLAAVCGVVVHALPERVPRLGRAFARDRAGLQGRLARPDGRRARPRRTLGDGPRAVAARAARRVADRARHLGGAEPELRARPLHAGVHPCAVGRCARRRSASRTIRAT